MSWSEIIASKLKDCSARSALIALLRVLVVVIPPFLLLQGLNNYYATENLKRLQSDQKSEMSQILGDIAGLADPQQRFDKEFKEFCSIPFPSETFDQRLKQILEANGKALDIFLFNSKKKCLDHKLLNKAPKFVAQKFLEAVLNPSSAEKNEKWLLRFSGYKKAHQAMNGAFSSITRIGRSDDRQWGGTFALKDLQQQISGYLTVFIKKSETDESELLNRSVKAAAQKHFKNYRFAWFDTLRPEKIFPADSLIPSEIPERLKALEYGINSFLFNGQQCLRHFTDSGLAVVALANHKVSKPVFHKYVSFSLLIFLIIGLLILFPLFLGLTVSKPGLQLKLVSALILGSGISVISLLFTGLIDRSERELVLKNHYQNLNIDELKKIDEGMTFEYKKLEMRIKQGIKKCSCLDKESFKNEIDSFWDHFDDISKRFREMIIVDKHQTWLFRPEKGLIKDKESDHSLAMYGKMILSTYMGEFQPPSPEKKSGTLKDVIHSSSAAFSRNFILKGGEFEILNLADSKVPTYIDFFLDRNKQGRAILIALLSQAGLQRNYLLDVSKQFDGFKDIEHPRFAAIPVNVSKAWPAFPKRRTAENEILKEISVKVVSGTLPVHKIARIQNKLYLLSAMRGNELDGYVLLLARPYSQIANQLKALNKRIKILAGAVIFIAAFLALLTSKLLLKPIKKLGQALSEISRGNFRIKLANEDVVEFNLVVNGLNKTLEGFHELNVASNVQENLWPAAGISGKDWEINGLCKTATELGGDHFDWFKPANGRILFTIGDVTGHGVASAMVQSSIKTWMAMNATSCESADELLNKINRLHCRYGAKKLPMSCWAGFYEPETGRLNFSSAGQSYPMLVDSQQKVSRLKLPGMPLGIREKNKYKCSNIVIEPGQTLVLYTDGIVESSNAAGEFFGFEGLEKAVANIVDMDPRQAMEHIFTEVENWGEQTDDRTIVILKRKREA
jgi:serine phosphatase RsbU (regulator of sigma subunit)